MRAGSTRKALGLAVLGCIGFLAKKVEAQETLVSASAQEFAFAEASCPPGMVISGVKFLYWGGASLGSAPEGQCSSFVGDSSCPSTLGDRSVIHNGCIGSIGCGFRADASVLGNPCPSIASKAKFLSFCVRCEPTASVLPEPSPAPSSGAVVGVPQLRWKQYSSQICAGGDLRASCGDAGGNFDFSGVSLDKCKALCAGDPGCGGVSYFSVGGLCTKKCATTAMTFIASQAEDTCLLALDRLSSEQIAALPAGAVTATATASPSAGVVPLGAKASPSPVLPIMATLRYTADQSGTGSEFFYTVPPRVNTVEVSLWGSGGASMAGSSYGGAGAYVTGLLPVLESEQLKITVGRTGALTGQPSGHSAISKKNAAGEWIPVVVAGAGGGSSYSFVYSRLHGGAASHNGTGMRGGDLQNSIFAGGEQSLDPLTVGGGGGSLIYPGHAYVQNLTAQGASLAAGGQFRGGKACAGCSPAFPLRAHGGSGYFGGGAGAAGGGGGSSLIYNLVNARGETADKSAHWLSPGKTDPGYLSGYGDRDSDGLVAIRVPPPCDPSGICWKGITQKLTFNDARAACKKLGEGWDLASIHDLSTWKSVSEDKCAQQLPAYAGFWVGLTNMNSAGQVSDWQHVNGASNQFFAANARSLPMWLPWEPNNPSYENCIHYRTDEGEGLNDVSCSWLENPCCSYLPPWLNTKLSPSSTPSPSTSPSITPSPAVADAKGALYKAIDGYTTFDAARASCKAIGAGWDLAAVYSEQSWNIIKNNCDGQSKAWGWWIGLRDATESQNGVADAGSDKWTFTNGASNAFFKANFRTLWNYPTEPNNAGSEYCVHVGYGSMNDYNCGSWTPSTCCQWLSSTDITIPDPSSSATPSPSISPSVSRSASRSASASSSRAASITPTPSVSRSTTATPTFSPSNSPVSANQVASSCYEAMNNGQVSSGVYTLNRGLGAFNLYCWQDAAVAGGGWDLVSVLGSPFTSVSGSCLFGPSRCTAASSTANLCLGNVAAKTLMPASAGARAYNATELGLGVMDDFELLVTSGPPGDPSTQWWLLRNWATTPGAFGLVVDYATLGRAVTSDGTCAYGTQWNACNTARSSESVRVAAWSSNAVVPHATVLNGSYTRNCGHWMQDRVSPDNTRVAFQLGYWNTWAVYRQPGSAGTAFNRGYLFARSKSFSRFPPSPSPSASVTSSPSLSASVSGSPSASASVSVVASRSPSVSVSASTSPSVSNTPSRTSSVTASGSVSPSFSPSVTPSSSVSGSGSISFSATMSLSATATGSPSESSSASASPSGTSSETASVSATTSASISPSSSATASSSVTGSVTPSQSASPSGSPSESLSPSESAQPTFSPTESPSESASQTTSTSVTASATESVSASVSVSVTVSSSGTATSSVSASVSASRSVEPTVSITLSASKSISPTRSASASPSPSASPSMTPSPSCTPAPKEERCRLGTSVIRIDVPGTLLISTPAEAINSTTAVSTLSCSWVITAPVGHKISLSFLAYAAQPNLDFLSAFDGASASAPSLLYMAGGASGWAPRPITSTGRSMYVWFQSTAYFSSKGLIAVPAFVPPEATTTTTNEVSVVSAADNTLLASSAAQLFVSLARPPPASVVTGAAADPGVSSASSSTRGQIYRCGPGQSTGNVNTTATIITTNPGLPVGAALHPTVDCSIIISAPQGFVVALSYLNYTLAPSRDYFSVFDGSSASSPALLYMSTSAVMPSNSDLSMPSSDAEKGATHLPPVVVSSGQYLYLRFQSVDFALVDPITGRPRGVTAVVTFMQAPPARAVAATTASSALSYQKRPNPLACLSVNLKSRPWNNAPNHPSYQVSRDGGYGSLPPSNISVVGLRGKTVTLGYQREDGRASFKDGGSFTVSLQSCRRNCSKADTPAVNRHPLYAPDFYRKRDGCGLSGLCVFLWSLTDSDGKLLQAPEMDMRSAITIPQTASFLLFGYSDLDSRDNSGTTPICIYPYTEPSPSPSAAAAVSPSGTPTASSSSSPAPLDVGAIVDITITLSGVDGVACVSSSACLTSSINAVNQTVGTMALANSTMGSSTNNATGSRSSNSNGIVSTMKIAAAGTGKPPSPTASNTTSSSNGNGNSGRSLLYDAETSVSSSFYASPLARHLLSVSGDTTLVASDEITAALLQAVAKDALAPLWVRITLGLRVPTTSNGRRLQSSSSGDGKAEEIASSAVAAVSASLASGTYQAQFAAYLDAALAADPLGEGANANLQAVLNALKTPGAATGGVAFSAVSSVNGATKVTAPGGASNNGGNGGSSSSDLSGGAIAGIVLGCVAFVSLGVAGFLIHRKRSSAVYTSRRGVITAVSRRPQDLRVQTVRSVSVLAEVSKQRSAAGTSPGLRGASASPGLGLCAPSLQVFRRNPIHAPAAAAPVTPDGGNASATASKAAVSRVMTTRAGFSPAASSSYAPYQSADLVAKKAANPAASMSAAERSPAARTSIYGAPPINLVAASMKLTE